MNITKIKKVLNLITFMYIYILSLFKNLPNRYNINIIYSIKLINKDVSNIVRSLNNVLSAFEWTEMFLMIVSVIINYREFNLYLNLKVLGIVCLVKITIFSIV